MKSEQEHARLEIISHGTVRVTLDVMVAHPRSADVQLRALGTLFNLTGDAGLRWVVQNRNDAVVCILAAMRNHASICDVIWNAAGVLCNISVDAVGRARMDELGAAPLLLEALRAHGSSHDVTRNACGALRNIATDAPKRPALLGGGAVVLLGVALRSHCDSVEVARNVAGAAWFLSEDPAGRAAIAVGDMLLAVHSAMDAHAGDADTQLRVLACAVHLAADTRTRPALLACSGFLTSLAAALRDHATSVDVVWRGAAVLASLARDGIDTRALIMRCDCLPLLIQGMRTFPHSILLQSHAVTALAHMCLEPGAARAVALDSVVCVFAAMRSMLFHARTAKYACAALYQLSCEVPARGTLLARGLVRPLVELMRAHVRLDEVAWRACGVLEQITREVELRADVPQPCVEQVVAFMCAHPALASVQWRACGTLVSRCRSGAVAACCRASQCE